MLTVSVAGQTVAIASSGRRVEPGLPTLLWLHGAGMDHSVWALPARHFAHAGWNALAIDLPGHGASAGPPLGAIADLADWVGRLLEALAIERVSLIGHSMGALVALEAAARQPARVAALALLGTALRMPVHPALLAAASTERARAEQLIASWALGPAGQPGGNPAPGGWLLGQTLQLLAHAPAGALAADLAACAAYQDGPAAAAAIRCRTLVLAGAQDRMAPARAAAELAARIAGARLVTLPGCGHMMMAEQPGATLDALIGWLAP